VEPTLSGTSGLRWWCGSTPGPHSFHAASLGLTKLQSGCRLHTIGQWCDTLSSPTTPQRQHPIAALVTFSQPRQLVKSGGAIWLPMSLRKTTIFKTTICPVHSNGKKAARSCRGHFERRLRTMGEQWLLKGSGIKTGERPVAGDNSTQPHPFQHRRVLRPEAHRLRWPTIQHGNLPYAQPGRYQPGHRALRCMVRFQISPEPPSPGPGPTLHRCQVNCLQLRHEPSK
jgi:hypothetical protein